MGPHPLQPRRGERRGIGELFSRFARAVSALTGHPATFTVAVGSVVVWAAFGPATGFSSDWQLWINTSTTILTFLMVFLLQNAQSRDTRALHLKIDEIIRAIAGARNDLIDVENLSESELKRYAAEFSAIHRRMERALERRNRPRPER